MVKLAEKAGEKPGGDVELSSWAKEIYEQEMIAKFLATTSREGVPNVALIISQLPVGPRSVIFGEFMMVKTQSNLSENPKVASLAITDKLKMAGFKGDLVEWVQTGPHIERINSIDFFRYNAYAGIHNVAVVEVNKLLDVPKSVGFAKAGLEFLGMRTAGRLAGGKKISGVETPEAVAQKFNSVMAVKVLSFPDDDGYPGIVPAISTRFRTPGELRFKVSDYNREIKKKSLPLRVAMNVVTLQPMTYQIKGELVRFESSMGFETGVVEVKEVYSSMPPLLGERIA